MLADETVAIQPRIAAQRAVRGAHRAGCRERSFASRAFDGRRRFAFSVVVAIAAVGGAWAGDSNDDVWAIRCLTIRGPDRQKVMKSYADALKRVKGLDAGLVRVFEAADASTLYYGQYRRSTNRSGEDRYKPDPKEDLSLIRTLAVRVDGQDAWPFYLATLEQLPATSSEHPEWEISNARGHWSLQVAVFYNTNELHERRKAASDYCKLLRQQGEEAYFHHGAASSEVCIGAFPRQAIQRVRKENPLTGVVTFSQRIVDQRMLALQQKYPHCLQNGAIFYEVVHDPQSGQKQKLPYTSFPVEIPGAETQPAASPRGG
jgi:hypothetical protein